MNLIVDGQGRSSVTSKSKPPSWIISNGHISTTAHAIHLYSTHRAVIFAIAQLSCDEMPYEQTLKAQGLLYVHSLQRRRLRGDLIETY